MSQGANTILGHDYGLHQAPDDGYRYTAQLYPPEAFGPDGLFFSRIGEAVKAHGLGWEYSRLGDVSTFRQFRKLPSIRKIKTLIKALERAE